MATGTDTVSVFLNDATVGGNPFTRVVSTLTIGEPVYDAGNSDYVLHVYENWSNHTGITDLGTALRSDGGPPWQDAGIKKYGSVVNSPDPFGSVRYVSTDYTVDPPIPPHGTGAHAQGYHWFAAGGDVLNPQGDDNAVNTSKMNRGFILPASAYLNKPAKASVVYEWAVRMRGTNWYGGKAFDINAGLNSGVARFNVDHGDSPLGWSSWNCTDPLCTTYYSDGGSTPRFPGVPPSASYQAPNIWRDYPAVLPGLIGASTVKYKQNMNWGIGASQFSWGRGALWPPAANNADLQGTNTPMWQAGWLYFKLQITKQAAGEGFGNGRIEMWVGQTTESLLKVMEYLGDVGQRDAGNVYVDPTGTSDQLGGIIGVYELIARNYTGGALVDIGTIRVWSHSRR
jgi:hypothetical protein